MARNNRTVDRIQAAWNILGGEEGVDRLISGQVRIAPAVKTLKTWIINLDADLKTASDFCDALKLAGMEVSAGASRPLSHQAFMVSGQKMEVELVVVSVRGLGFEGRATLRDIYYQAAEYGLSRCPPEVALQLRLQYKDQPKGGFLAIAMEPINDPHYGPTLLCLTSESEGLGVDAFDGDLNDSWESRQKFIFLRRKRK